MKTRIILTVLAIAGWLTFNSWSPSVAPIVSGVTSVSQLDNSNAGYFTAKAGTMFSGSGISIWILLGVVAAIWASTIISKMKNGIFSTLVLATLLLTLTANATILDKNTYLSEFKSIGPNQTAFLVPMQGANATSQKQFDSGLYLGIAAVAAKRIQIPHTKLEIADTWGNTTVADKYIPSACLYVVSREPYSRLWCKEATRGTSTANQGTFLESSSGVNIDFSTTIAASISPTNAALYLYNFGVSAKLDGGDTADYPSALYARDLSDVMDNVVFNDAHQMLAMEFGKRTFTECCNQKTVIFTKVESQLKEKYATMGITISYFGLGSQMNFDQKIQDSINNVEIAIFDANAASNRMAAMPVLQALADINMKNSAAAALARWDGKLPALPSFAVVPNGIFDGIGGILGMKK
jgi:hypothetical protein